MTIRQIEVAGRQRKGREEAFEADQELWNVYKLASGDRVRIKVVVHKIFRVVDDAGNPLFTPEGDPEIIVRHQIQVSASSDIGPDVSGEAN